MHINVLVVAAVFVVHAKAFIAWDGTGCDGAIGANVPCDGGCGGYTGRKSFIADTDGSTGTHCVSLYTAPGCTGERINITGQRTQCTEAVTCDGAVGYRCFRGEACL